MCTWHLAWVKQNTYFTEREKEIVEKEKNSEKKIFNQNCDSKWQARRGNCMERKKKHKIIFKP